MTSSIVLFFGFFPISNRSLLRVAFGYFFRNSIAPFSHGAGPLCETISGNFLIPVSMTIYPESPILEFHAIGSKSLRAF